MLSWYFKLFPINHKHVCLFPWALRKLTNAKIGYKEADSSNNIAHTILLPAAAAHPTHSPPPSPPPPPPSVQHHYQHKGRRIHCIFKPFSDHARLGDESKQGTYSINPWALCILTLHRVREGEENLKPSVYYSLVSPAVYSHPGPQNSSLTIQSHVNTHSCTNAVNCLDGSVCHGSCLHDNFVLILHLAPLTSVWGFYAHNYSLVNALHYSLAYSARFTDLFCFSARSES